MGSLFSGPKPPAQPQPRIIYVPEPAPVSTVSASSSSSSSSSGGAASGGSGNSASTGDAGNDTAQENTAPSEEQQREVRTQNLLSRNRGRYGTITTSFRGLLNSAQQDNGQRKTLLGE